MSFFCEKSDGKERFMSSKSCVFPPTHFTNGLADVYVLLLIFWYSCHFQYKVIKTLQPYEESLTGVELKIYTILKERSKIHPDWTIKQILEELKPVYCRQLRKQQAPIFHELSEIFKTLPEEYNSKFKFLMENYRKMPRFVIF